MLKHLQSQARGKHFEARLVHQARLNGLWLMHAGTQTRFLRGGKTIAVKSDLDFKLYNRDGKMAAFDAKSFGKDHLVYSDLTAHQITRAAEYAAWGVRSGFVVHFRPIQEVVYFGIDVISMMGRRSRFSPCDGHTLGPEHYFNLRLVLL